MIYSIIDGSIIATLESIKTMMKREMDKNNIFFLIVILSDHGDASDIETALLLSSINVKLKLFPDDYISLLDFLARISMIPSALRGRLSREFLLTSLVGAVAKFSDGFFVFSISFTLHS